MEKLDEKGFVFIDGNGLPFHVRMWGGTPWLFYWHPDNKWVSLCEINQNEIWIFNENAISKKQAEVYHKLNKGE